MRISDWSSDVCSSDLKRFIFALGPVRYRASSAVHDRNHGLDGWKAGKQRIDYREEVAMDEKNLGVRVLQGVGDLRLGKPDVHGLQDRAHHGNSELGLEVAMAVPVHDRDGHDLLLP